MASFGGKGQQNNFFGASVGDSDKKKRKTSDWLDQLGVQVDCKYSQDVVDGLRQEIRELKAEIERLKKEETRASTATKKINATTPKK